MLNRSAVSAAAILCLAGCDAAGGSPAGQNTQTAEKTAVPATPPATPPVPAPIDMVEQVLIEQLSCKAPPRAGTVMGALFRRGMIAKTSEGADGVGVFVPVKPMTLMGMKVVRLGGWEPGPYGAMPPFSRGPGTPPPNFIFVTVEGSEADVRQQLSARSITEARLVKDETQPTDKYGGPYRWIPGAEISSDKYIYGADPVGGVTMIECSAGDYDFIKDIEFRLSK